MQAIQRAQKSSTFESERDSSEERERESTVSLSEPDTSSLNSIEESDVLLVSNGGSSVFRDVELAKKHDRAIHNAETDSSEETRRKCTTSPSEPDASSIDDLVCECDGRDTENLLSGLELANGEEVIPNKLLSYKVKKVLFHGSLFAAGVCILIAGGVSSRFHPHVDPEQYYNCTAMDNSSSILF